MNCLFRLAPLPACVLVLTALSLPAAPAGAQPQSAACGDWQQCRDLAREAREAEDYERFHDLAWRAMQRRGARDPDLFFLLARAQSLSGRPQDALVTLRRLATELGAPRDVSDDPDFQRVRNLPAWPELQALFEGGAKHHADAATPGDTAVAPGRSAGVPPAPGPPSEASLGRSSRASAPAAEEMARFAAAPFNAGGLAYDAVSARFVIGNLPSRKLTVVSEGSSRAATLSGDLARFLDVQAIDIDRQQGNLWVVSTGKRADSDGKSELHKVQLISGRVLGVFSAEPDARLVDVAANGGGVLVLDAAKPRVLRPANGDNALVPVVSLPAGAAVSLAPAAGRRAYVAYADEIVSVDLATGSASRVRGASGLTLSGFERIRWHRGALIGIQAADGTHGLVRLSLNRNGSSVVAIEPLDWPAEAGATTLAFDITGDHLYYLVRDGTEAAIRRMRLK